MSRRIPATNLAPGEHHCRECCRTVDEFPHVHRQYAGACDHCDAPMAGTARQVMDAAEVHGRLCPGLLRPLEVAT